MKNLYCPILFVLVIGCNLSAKKETKPTEDSLDYYPPTPKEISKSEFRRYYNIVKNHFDNSLLDRGFNGQLLIAKGGTVIYDSVMGFSDLRTKDSLTDNTPMHIASVSKTFTGMAVLHLMELGRLNLDDTLGKYFPAFPYPGITIKMLLSHRSGLPNYLHYLSLLKKDDTCYSNEDVLSSLYTLHPGLEHRSGTRFSYSNTNYVLLAMIVEKISNQPFPVFMRDTFFTPLQMTHTFVYAHQDTLMPTPSFEWTGRYWSPDPFDCTYGDKNVYTTTHDLLKWDQALSSGQLFKKETLDSAYMPLSNERRSIHNYGLGWRMMCFSTGKKLIYHNGRWHGSNAVFVRFLDENATMIIIGNKYNSKIYKSAQKAYNIFGGYVPGEPSPADDNDDDGADSVAKATEEKEPAIASITKRTNSPKRRR